MGKIISISTRKVLSDKESETLKPKLEPLDINYPVNCYEFSALTFILRFEGINSKMMPNRLIPYPLEKIISYLIENKEHLRDINSLEIGDFERCRFLINDQKSYEQINIQANIHIEPRTKIQIDSLGIKSQDYSEQIEYLLAIYTQSFIDWWNEKPNPITEIEFENRMDRDSIKSLTSSRFEQSIFGGLKKVLLRPDNYSIEGFSQGGIIVYDNEKEDVFAYPVYYIDRKNNQILVP